MQQTTERRPRLRRRIEAVAKQLVVDDTRQMALALDVAPQPDLAPGEPEVAVVVIGKGVARLALAKATWAFALVRAPAALPLPLSSALAAECTAVVESPIAKAADAKGPHIEYGLHTDAIHEYFVTKGADMNGILLIKRKPDGSWGASVSKVLTPYVVTKAAVKAGVMPPAGQSALPKSLERVVPEKFAYWKRSDATEAAAVRNALVDSGFFDDRLIKVVDGDIRLCIEQLFLYEPSDPPAVGKADAPLRPMSFNDVLMLALPAVMTGKRLSTPLAPEHAATWRDALKSETDCLVLSAPTVEQLDEVVDELAKGDAVAPWVVEFDDTPAARLSMGMLGRVFKVGTADAENRLFVASHALELDTRITYLDTPLEKATWSGAYVNDLPDGAFLYVEGGGEKDEEGKTKPRSLRHFPYKDKDGKTDLPHLRNAVARIPQSSIGADKKTELQARARRMLDTAQKSIDPSVVDEISKRVVRIGKKTEKADEHYVLGIVLEPEVVDAQNDVYSADEIRTTAHEFMQKYRTIGLMHKGGINDKVKILESYIAPCDFEADGAPVKAGTWVMAVKVLDEDLWKACKSGELTGFSIGGSAIRKPETAAAAGTA